MAITVVKCDLLPFSFRVNSILFNLILLCCIVNEATSSSFLRVEDYIGDWCVRQFSEEFQQQSNIKIEKDVPIEPYIGKWCDVQFSQQVSPPIVGDDIIQLYRSHVEVEKQLLEWGSDSDDSDSKLRLEPYLVSWCIETWPEKLRNNGISTLMNIASEKGTKVPLEPQLGGWCLETYPNALASLPSLDEIISDLYQSHESIEEDMSRWYGASETRSSRRQKSRTVIGMSTTIILIVGILAGIGAYKRRNKQSDVSRDNNNSNSNQEIASPPEIRVTELT